MPSGAAGPAPPIRSIADRAPTDFFRAIYAAAGRAQQAAGGAIDRCYAIAGYHVRLRFAGPALVPLLTPALEHLAVPAGAAPPDLTVCLLDSASTGTRMLPLPWAWDDILPRGEVRGYNDNRIHTAFNAQPGLLRLLDRAQARAVLWIRDASSVPLYERGAPLLAILHWWMADHGRQLLHAAAVGHPTGGVLLVGKGGSGKSTAALACLRSDLLYAGDDYCLLASGPAPYAYSLYNSGKLNADSLQRLPHLAPAVDNSDRPDGEKALCMLYQHYPQKLTRELPIRAILVPHISGRVATTLVPTAPGPTLRALAPSTLLQVPGAGPAAFTAMARLVQQVPAYRLEVGTDLTQVPALITQLLS